jgi:hypothetical protein
VALSLPSKRDDFAFQLLRNKSIQPRLAREARDSAPEGEDVNESATELMKTITPARIESWAHSAPMDWANESFAIAEQARTEYCIRQGASCDHPSGKVKIDAAYVAVNTPTVREQLQKAGVRLAHMLDAALGK